MVESFISIFFELAHFFSRSDFLSLTCAVARQGDDGGDKNFWELAHKYFWQLQHQGLESPQYKSKFFYLINRDA